MNTLVIPNMGINSGYTNECCSLFQDAVAQLKDYDTEADEASQTQYLEALHTRLQTNDLAQKLQAIPE